MRKILRGFWNRKRSLFHTGRRNNHNLLQNICQSRCWLHAYPPNLPRVCNTSQWQHFCTSWTLKNRQCATNSLIIIQLIPIYLWKGIYTHLCLESAYIILEVRCSTNTGQKERKNVKELTCVRDRTQDLWLVSSFSFFHSFWPVLVEQLTSIYNQVK